MAKDYINGVRAGSLRRRITRILVLSLLFMFILQTAALAADASTPVYLKQDGRTVLLTGKIQSASLSDTEQLLKIRRTLACVEVDPQIVTLSGRGTNSPTFTLTPEFPDCTGSAELAQMAAEIAYKSREQDDFDQQILYIAKTIRNSAEYDTEGVRNGNLAENRCAYGTLVNGLATCEGYANAFLLVCKAAGFPCVRVLGYYNGVYHTWNAVYNNGSWYMCDLTESGFLLLPEESILQKSNYSDIDWDVYTAAKSYCLGGELNINL